MTDADARAAAQVALKGAGFGGFDGDHALLLLGGPLHELAGQQVPRSPAAEDVAPTREVR